MRQYGITLLIAPLGSGKSTLLRQLETVPGIKSSTLTILDDFDSKTCLQESDGPTIEGRVAAGQRFLIAAELPLDDMFAVSRVSGLVAEFTLKDFALTEAEVSEFLGEDLAQGIGVRTRRVLLEKTEGWIPAWNILRNLLSRGAVADELAHSFSGRDRDLAAYFDQFVMRRVSAEVAQFLRDIAPLEHITPSSAQAASGRADCVSLLKAAASACPFLINLDRNGEARRLHQLFRDYLIGVAKISDPVRYAASALQAADRASADEDWLAAARLYSEAGATNRSVEILHRYTDDLIMSRGEVQGVRRLMGSIPQIRSGKSSLLAEQALGSIIAGDFANASNLLAEAHAGDAHADDQSDAKLEAIRICIGFGRERFQEVRSAAVRWLSECTQADPRYRTMVAAAQFWSSLAERDSAGADRALVLAREAVSLSSSPFLEGWLAVMDAVFKYEHGHVSAAAHLLEESAETGMIRDTVNLMRAALALEQGRLAYARRFIQSSLRIGARHSVVDTSLYGWETAARLAAKDTGVLAALELLDEAEALVASRHGARATRLVRLRRAKLLLQGADETRHGELRTELESLCNDAVAHSLCTSYTEEAQLTLARCYALSGDPRRAIALVQPIQVSAQRRHRTARWGAATLIYAGALARLDELNRAARQAWSGIAQMVSGGYSMSITDEHVLLIPVIDNLIRRVADEAKVDTGLHLVIDQLAARAGRARLSVRASPAADDYHNLPSLTETERRVLALAAQGRSNADIAEQAAMQLTTVKWHMRNVFAKLSVRSRTAAIVQARRLGIDV